MISLLTAQKIINLMKKKMREVFDLNESKKWSVMTDNLKEGFV